MTRHFERQIDRLKEKILVLGGMVEKSVDEALRAIESRNVELAQKVIAGDDAIDEMEVEVEEECLHTLALYNPVASDVRYVVAMVTINKDLERIGDLATSLAEEAIFLADEPPIQQAPFDIMGEGRRVRMMLKNCLDALVNRDAALARQVLKADDEVDRMHREMYRAVKEAIRQNPLETGRFIELLNTSRQLERIADHAVNIAEDVIYVVEGRIVRHRPDLQQEQGGL
jgi:phosphate transport system protein